MKKANQVIGTVLLTEKCTGLNAQNQYAFRVHTDANRMEIRRAVEELFKVHVLKVNTMNVKGKLRRERTMQYGRTSGWKKAVVTLQAGESITLQ